MWQRRRYARHRLVMIHWSRSTINTSPLPLDAKPPAPTHDAEDHNNSQNPSPNAIRLRDHIDGKATRYRRRIRPGTRVALGCASRMGGHGRDRRYDKIRTDDRQSTHLSTLVP